MEHYQFNCGECGEFYQSIDATARLSKPNQPLDIRETWDMSLSKDKLTELLFKALKPDEFSDLNLVLDPTCLEFRWYFNGGPRSGVLMQVTTDLHSNMVEDNMITSNDTSRRLSALLHRAVADSLEAACGDDDAETGT